MRLFILLALLLQLSACGLKGELRIPEPEPQSAGQALPSQLVSLKPKFNSAYIAATTLT